MGISKTKTSNKALSSGKNSGNTFVNNSIATKLKSLGLTVRTAEEIRNDRCNAKGYSFG